jgi:hypothetical protein
MVSRSSALLETTGLRYGDTCQPSLLALDWVCPPRSWHAQVRTWHPGYRDSSLPETAYENPGPPEFSTFSRHCQGFHCCFDMAARLEHLATCRRPASYLFINLHIRTISPLPCSSELVLQSRLQEPSTSPGSQVAKSATADASTDPHLPPSFPTHPPDSSWANPGLQTTRTQNSAAKISQIAS